MDIIIYQVQSRAQNTEEAEKHTDFYVSCVP